MEKHVFYNILDTLADMFGYEFYKIDRNTYKRYDLQDCEWDEVSFNDIVDFFIFQFSEWAYSINDTESCQYYNGVINALDELKERR